MADESFEWTAGTSVAPGTTPTALPDGDITAAGIYYPGTTSAFRLDDFTIVAVPEPGSITLLGLAGFWLLTARRRRA